MAHPSNARRASLMRRLALACLALGLPGCEPVSLTMMGVGAAYGVQHTLSGITYRTFSAPLPQVRTAVKRAFAYMDIKIGATEKIENGERLLARASDRDIEVELEALTPRTTRMRATAKNGIFRDAATATEIVLQTERLLGGSEVTTH